MLLQSRVPYDVLFVAMALRPLGQDEPHTPALLEEQLWLSTGQFVAILLSEVWVFLDQACDWQVT